MRTIKYIVIHEAACTLRKESGNQFTIEDVDLWHQERGFQRGADWRSKFHPELKAVGYHYVLGIDGQIWEGRHLEEVPAAVKGFNSVSINICMIGQGRYTEKQWAALKFITSQLTGIYPTAEITGHCNPAFNSGKTCPNFNVAAWVDGGMEPQEGHIDVA